ncbi:hypothetical protein C0J52_04827 [Blattella germanica]|nr:hypothetical protein C0J52_04827 [Blattella germanica]
MKLKMDFHLLAVIGLLFAYDPSFCKAENATESAVIVPPTTAPPPAEAGPSDTTPAPAPTPPKEKPPLAARLRELIINGPIRKYLWENGIIKSWWTDPQKNYPIKTLERFYNATDPIVHFFEGVSTNIDNFYHNIVLPAINAVLKLSPLGPIWGVVRSFGSAIYGINLAFKGVRLSAREFRRRLLHSAIAIREKRPLGHVIFNIASFSRNALLIINSIYSFFEAIFMKFVSIVRSIIRFLLGVFAKIAFNVAQFLFGIARALFQFFVNSMKKLFEFTRRVRRGFVKTVLQTMGNIISTIWTRFITRLSSRPLFKFLKPLVPPK